MHTGSLQELMFPRLTKELYHGSDIKFDTLKPTAYNAGHRFKRDSWSVFMWPTYDLAYLWAIFVTIKNTVRGHDIIRPTGYHERTGFNKYKFHLFMNGKDEEEMKRLCIGKKAYVYTVDCPINTRFNVGNNNAQPEYTYDGELEIKKRDEFTLTEEVIDKNVSMLSDEEYKNFNASSNWRNIRGPLGYIFYDLDSIIDKWGYVYMKLGLKEIKPGDDLEEIMKHYSEKDRAELKERFKAKFNKTKGSTVKRQNSRL